MYEKEYLFSAVVKAYGLERAREIFKALSLTQWAELAEALSKPFPALQFTLFNGFLEVEELPATYADLWFHPGEPGRLVVPLVKAFLNFTGFIYLALPPELKEMAHVIEEEVRRRL